MNIELVRDTHAFRELKEAWDRLLEQSTSASVFLTWEWLFPWWLHLRGRRSLWILLARDEASGQLLGIAPFCLRKQWHPLPLKKIEFLGADKVASDFLDVILAPGHEESVLAAWRRYLQDCHDWDMLDLTAIDEHSNARELLRAVAGSGSRVWERPIEICPCMRLPDDEKVFFASLSSTMRQHLKHQIKHLAAECQTRFSLTEDAAHVRQDIDALFRLHQDRYQSKSGRKPHTSNFSGDLLRRFHYEVAAGFLSQGWLRLHFLWAGEERVACIYGFRFKNRHYAYQTGLHSSWAKWSPGSILFNHAIRDCIAGKVAEFHFLRGHETYKSKWTKTAKIIYNAIGFNTTPAGQIYRGYCSLKDRIKKALLKTGLPKASTA